MSILVLYIVGVFLGITEAGRVADHEKKSVGNIFKTLKNLRSTIINLISNGFTSLKKVNNNGHQNHHHCTLQPPSVPSYADNNSSLVHQSNFHHVNLTTKQPLYFETETPVATLYISTKGAEEKQPDTAKNITNVKKKNPDTLENISFTSENMVPVMPDLMQVQMMGLKRVLLPALARLVNTQERHAGIDNAEIDNAGEGIINISDTLYREDIMGIE